MPYCGVTSNVKDSVGLCLSAMEIKPKYVRAFLERHPDFLENYLIYHLDEEFIYRILSKKKRTAIDVSTKVAVETDTEKSKTADPNLSFSDVNSSKSDIELYRHIYDISDRLARLIRADQFCLYVICEHGLGMYNWASEVQLVEHVKPIAAYVAIDKIAVNVSAPRLKFDPRFNKVIDPKTNTLKLYHSVCVPILTESRGVFGIVEFERPKEFDSFSDREFEIICGVYAWITVCVQRLNVNRSLRLQGTLNESVLHKTRVLFENVLDLDDLVKNILTVTKETVPCDRCTLHLMDDNSFEITEDANKGEEDIQLFTKISRYRQNQNVIEYVAQTGKVVNIKDADKNELFNLDVDQNAGYPITSVLCMPIEGPAGKQGVIQMINKLDGDHFTSDEEEKFQLLTVYCSLALQYNRIHHNLVQSQEKLQIAMGVFQHGPPPAVDEITTFERHKILKDEEVPPDFDTFGFCCYDYTQIIPQLFLKIVFDVIGERVQTTKLCRFILTVRKQYQQLPYHNWLHAFHVAHCLWRIINNCKGLTFTTLEKMSLIIAGTCHGIHNDFRHQADNFRNTGTQLAAFYAYSSTAQHNFKQTIAILHEKGNDILSFLTSDQHKDLIEMIREHMSATDLNTYLANQKFLSGLNDNKEFNMAIPEHRDAVIRLMIVGAEFCIVCKPWDVQIRTARMINEEFYEGYQGELQATTQKDTVDVKLDILPKHQVAFLKTVCEPLYETLKTLLPETKPLLDGCLSNKAKSEALSRAGESERKVYVDQVPDIATEENSKKATLRNIESMEETDKSTSKKDLIDVSNGSQNWNENEQRDT